MISPTRQEQGELSAFLSRGSISRSGRKRKGFDGELSEVRVWA